MRPMSPPSLRASTKLLVPDFATVPKLFTRSVRVIPIPVSLMVNVFFSSSKLILISRSLFSPRAPTVESATNLILSNASLAFEMSSRKKTSLFLSGE